MALLLLAMMYAVFEGISFWRSPMKPEVMCSKWQCHADANNNNDARAGATRHAKICLAFRYGF